MRPWSLNRDGDLDFPSKSTTPSSAAEMPKTVIVGVDMVTLGVVKVMDGFCGLFQDVDMYLHSIVVWRCLIQNLRSRNSWGKARQVCLKKRGGSLTSALPIDAQETYGVLTRASGASLYV